MKPLGFVPHAQKKKREKEKRKLDPKGTGTEVEYGMSANNNKGPIRVLQSNADSLPSKKKEFKLFSKKWKVDVFLIQETKMTSKECKDNKLVIPGYTLVHKPRKQTKGSENNRGGGLLTGIRNTIPYSEIQDINVRDDNDAITEWLTVEIPTGNGGKWRISNVYIPSERAEDCRGSVAGESMAMHSRRSDCRRSECTQHHMGSGTRGPREEAGVE